ncbi:MAG: hypothetical protein OQK46_05960 [Gammaproteobacteria bacterium]|nr:hypothetical protein [Gammaproteobacteria bacterium]
MKAFFKIIRTGFIFIICANMYACALLQSTPESLDNDINLWLSQNEFDEIDDALKNINKKNKKYNPVLNRKPYIIKQKNKFIEDTSTTAQAYQNENKWQLALDTYNNALEKIKDNPRLSKEREKLLKDREIKVTALRIDMLMKRANALISYKEIYSKLHALVPHDYSAQFDINRYEKDRLEVASYLMMCGDQALKKRQHTLALDCYTLSNNLAPSKQKAMWVEKIDSQLKNKSNKKRYEDLLSSYKSALQKEDYKRAKLHLNTMLAIDPSHKKAKSLLTALNDKLREQAATKITRGKELYSEKKINDALLIWQQALLLEPDNEELNQLISRAEKVSKKIQSLEKSQ